MKVAAKTAATKVSNKAIGGGSGGSKDEGEADVPPTPEVKTVRQNRVIRTKNKKQDEEWLAQIDKNFFSEDFDGTKYVLDKTDHLDLMELEEFRDERFQELHAVSRKFAGLVNENAEKFVQELTRVSELQDQLEYATLLVKSERTKLQRADDVVVTALDVVRQTKRKAVLRGILEAVTEIRQLSKAQEQLQELLTRHEFVEAIELTRRSTEKLVEYSERGFTIVEDLASNLQDTTMMIEEHVDTALATLCADEFSLQKYEEIVRAYELLGRPHAACDRLGSCFVAAIHVKTKQVMRETILGKKAQQKKRAVRATPADSGAFKRMCKKMTKDQFEPCLMGLCGAVCGLMVSYAEIATWHKARHPEESVEEPINETAPSQLGEKIEDKDDNAQDDQGEDNKDETASSPATPALDLTDDADPLESLMGRSDAVVRTPSAAGKSSRALSAATPSRMSVTEYESMKLELHRRRLWQDAQRQIAIFLHEVDLSEFPLPQYLQLLSHVRRLISIGETFSEFKSNILESAIRKNALTYLAAFHKTIIDDLKKMLSVEEWVSLDIVKDFNIFLLKEWNFLRRKSKSGSVSDESTTTTNTLEEFAENPDLFLQHRVVIADSDTKGILGSSSKSTKKTPIVEKTTESEGSSAQAGATSKVPPPPHCSKTSMAVVRYFGRYVQIMDVLKPVAGEAMQCLIEVYAMYVDTTWNFFAKDCTVYGLNILSQKANFALGRLKHMKTPKKDGTDNPLLTLVMEPLVLSENIPLDSESSLFGLQFRITALESLSFLNTVLRSIKNNIVKRLPPTVHKFMNGFYVELVDVLPEIRWFVYKGVTAKFIKLDAIIKLMDKVKWDVKEILSQHNSYVDHLVKELNIVGQRLDAFGSSRLPAVAYNSIWLEIMEQTNRTFCEGFATAKKCTSEGRALMQLDYRQYQSKLAKVCTIKPATSHVDNFIRAFYLQEEEIEAWVKTNMKKYTKKELSNVVNVSSAKLAKKDRQKYLKMIEDG